MGRLLAIALVVAAAGVATVLVVGPGENRPEHQEEVPVAGTSPPREDERAEPPPAREAPRPGERPRVGATVAMRALRFAPATVSVAVGRAVRWTNRDDVVHDVVEDVGPRSGVAPAFLSGRIPPGRSFSYVALKPGTLRFVCTLHPTVMQGRLVVRD